MSLTEGHAALRAARGLLGGLGVDEVGVDLMEVTAAGLRRALGVGSGRATLVKVSMRSVMGVILSEAAPYRI